MTGAKNESELIPIMQFRMPLAFLIAFAWLGGPRAQGQDTGPPPASEVLTVEDMRADLAVFRDDFLARDQSYSPDAREDAEARLAALEDGLEHVGRAEFELRLAQIVSLADNGHTISFAGDRSSRFNRVSIRVFPFGEDFYVLRATEPNAELLGARVVDVGGTAISEIRGASRALVGGTPAWRDRVGSYLIESPEQLHALGLAPDPAGAVYAFETSDGARIERFLAGDPAGERPGRTSRWIYPELLEEEVGEWRALMDPDLAPWALQDAGESFRSREVRELDAMVIELRRNNNAPGKPIRVALREFRQVIEEAGRSNVILDMRQNGGGDLNTTRDFMESLPDLVPGRIFVLISPWTFSAAISSIGYLKQTAPDRVVIIGEGPGDRLEFFSEGSTMTLPNSGVMLLAATERHDYRTGCEGFSDCHGSVVRHPIAVDSLAPDIAAPWTFAVYAAGRDPGMEAVARVINGE